MRIAFSYASYRFTDSTEDLGGEELIAWKLISTLARKGHVCHVFSPCIELSQKYENVVPHAIDGVDYRKDFLRRSRIRKAVSYRRQVRRQVRELAASRQIDVIHHVLPAYAGFPSSVADLPLPFVYGPAMVTYSRAIEESARFRFGVETLYQAAKRLQWRRTLRRAEAILLEVDYVTREIPRFARGKTVTVYKGVDPEEFAPASAGSVSRGPDLTVLYAAALRRNKGIHVLLQAIPDLLEQRRDLRFVIVGPVREPAVVEPLLDPLRSHPRVDIVGQVRHDSIPEYFRQADLYCFPTLQDNAPASLLEAMACGLPIVASDVMGVPEIVRQGENGLLFKPGDSQGLREAILEAVSDRERLRQWGLAGKQRIEQELTWDAFATRVERVYERVSEHAG